MFRGTLGVGQHLTPTLKWCDFTKKPLRIKRNKRFVKMRELAANGYFELSKGI